MPNVRKSNEVFEQDFLPLRAKLIELAAALDRLDRAEGSVESEPRRMQVNDAINMLLQSENDRAEQIQLIFSRPYEDNWREKVGV